MTNMTGVLTERGQSPTDAYRDGCEGTQVEGRVKTEDGTDASTHQGMHEDVAAAHQKQERGKEEGSL